MIKGIIFDFNRTIYNPDSDDLVEGANKLLDKLRERGYKLCLISKKSKDDKAKRISNLGLDKYFIDIQVIEGNKTEEHFNRCLKATSLNPGEMAVVGDRIKEEISLGNRMRMTTIWYKAGKFSTELPENEEEIPRYTITDLEEVIKCLEPQTQTNL